MEDANTIKHVLKRYADDEIDRFPSLSKPEEQAKENIYVSDEILKGIKNAVISGEEDMKYLSWAVNIGKRRIEQIVSNKYRKAYIRAAEVLVALAECFLLKGEREKSRNIVEEFRDQKYNRYSAFRREVNAVLSASSLLNW